MQKIAVKFLLISMPSAILIVKNIKYYNSLASETKSTCTYLLSLKLESWLLLLQSPITNQATENLISKNKSIKLTRA